MTDDPNQHGRGDWRVEQPSRTTQGAEGPVEVVFCRVLSRRQAIAGRPCLLLHSFTLTGPSGTHSEVGGRFGVPRQVSSRTPGQWPWHGEPPSLRGHASAYRGLLVILMMFDSSNLKNVDDTVYELETAHSAAAPRGGTSSAISVPRWARPAVIAPRRRTRCERSSSATASLPGSRTAFVRFDYRGWQRELLQRRIAPGRCRRGPVSSSAVISDRQWHDAFRAAGYEPAVAEFVIGQLQRRIGQRPDVF